MRVTLDFNSVLHTRHSGFFTYGAGLLSGFAQLQNYPDFTLLTDSNSAYNKLWLNDLPQTLNCRWAKLPGKARHWEDAWKFLAWPNLQKITGPTDIYHCNHHLMPPTKNAPKVLTVHDLRRQRLPEFYPDSKTARFEYAVAKADHFIAISHSTKRDLQELFNIPESRITVVHHGGPLKSALASPNPNFMDDYSLEQGRYFITFSSYDRRKNIEGCIKAFQIAENRLPLDYKVVIVGNIPAQTQRAIAQVSEKVRGRIVCTGPLDDIFSPMAYAATFLCVSLYEGFGLPLLEAMAAKTPIIASNSSSLPEVAGEAAILADPNNPEQIAEAMVKLCNSKHLRDKLVAAGKERCTQFSWKRAAEQTLAVYQKLL